jgi:hypothetical protein
MAVCLKFDDILDLGKPQLAHLEEVGNSFASMETPGACEAFAREVRLLESFLIQTYAVAVAVAKRADNFEEVAQVWQHMGLFCTKALHSLKKLKDKYPHCGTSQLFDLALDYKLACEKRFRGISEEIECQKQNLPKGLFPEEI